MLKHDIVVITLGCMAIGSDLGLFTAIGIWLIAITMYTKK